MSNPPPLHNPFALSADDGYFWLKGNLHSHTTNSDGRALPQERVDGYANAGYDFLCLSDHNTITPIESVQAPASLTLIQGVELHPDNPFGGQRHHFLALNVTEDMDARNMPPQHVIDAVREQGGSIWLAHPYWSSVNILRDVLPLHGLAGIEVFNATCRNMGRGESGPHWDDWLSLTGQLFPALSNDDSHDTEATARDTYQGWTMVRVRERTPAAITAALVSGASYSSNGPNIFDIRLEALTPNSDQAPRVRAHLQTSPAQRIWAIGDVYGREVYAGGTLFEQAQLDLPRSLRWVRFEIVGPDGSKAWSNPFDLRPFGE